MRKKALHAFLFLFFMRNLIFSERVFRLGAALLLAARAYEALVFQNLERNRKRQELKDVVLLI